jgi:hypothetical protein
VPREGFRPLSGEELIEVYSPEGGMVKAFCRVCGSSVFGGHWPEGRRYRFAWGRWTTIPGSSRK